MAMTIIVLPQRITVKVLFIFRFTVARVVYYIKLSIEKVNSVNNIPISRGIGASGISSHLQLVLQTYQPTYFIPSRALADRSFVQDTPPVLEMHGACPMYGKSSSSESRQNLATSARGIDPA
jgi:hypothetical protein